MAAAWELHKRLQSLQEGPASGTPHAAAHPDETRLSHSMAGMTAVTAQRQRLLGLQRGFVDRATAYLQQQLAAVAEGLPPARPGRPPDHAALRRRAGQLAPLLEVVGALRPAAVVAPREAYCQVGAVGFLGRDARWQ